MTPLPRLPIALALALGCLATRSHAEPQAPIIPNAASPDRIDDLLVIDNGTLRVGVSPGMGGSIVWISFAARLDALRELHGDEVSNLTEP